MDTSPTYISMCHQAVEIQQLLCSNRRNDRSHMVPVKGGWVELAYQDQLQEIIYAQRPDLAGIHREHDLIDELTLFMAQIGTGVYHSMEQYWLAFAMKEVCRKQWNGRAWMPITATA